MNTQLQTRPGANLNHIVNSASELAKQTNTVVEFDYQGIKVLVDKESKTDFIQSTFNEALKTKRKTRTIGPVYNKPEKIGRELYASPLLKLSLK